MIQWLGGDQAEGCLLFDESHKAKNLVSEEGEDGKPTKGKKSTKMAITVQNLQRECPKARVVYCSATGATSLAHMAYMERLGLWGEQTPFPKFGDFQKAMGNGQNVGAMELVALDMKRRGMPNSNPDPDPDPDPNPNPDPNRNPNSNPRSRCTRRPTQ